MQTPVDYPIIDKTHSEQFSVDELTYATFLDRMEALDSSVDSRPVHALIVYSEQTSPPTSKDNSLLKSLTILAQSLLARDNIVKGVTPVISRWSRALR
ncbi:MAG: hypothetical protein AB8B64_09365 [Granulosicoccus sp.]